MENIEKTNLELVLENKIKPILKDATIKYLGVNIDKLNEDISTKLSKQATVDIKPDFSLKYKDAKKKYKKEYLEKVLKLKLGNISEAAKVVHTDRRSIHRLIQDFHIDIKKIKHELIKPYSIKVSTINYALENTLDKYKEIIHPKKLETMYKNLGLIADDIVKELPETPATLKEAQDEFDKEYLKQKLADNNNNVALTAKKIGLRYETLHRKIKKFGFI